MPNESPRLLGRLVQISVNNEKVVGLVLAQHRIEDSEQWADFTPYLPPQTCCVLLPHPLPGIPAVHLQERAHPEIAQRCFAVSQSTAIPVAPTDLVLGKVTIDPMLDVLVRHLTLEVISPCCLDGRNFFPGTRGQLKRIWRNVDGAYFLEANWDAGDERFTWKVSMCAGLRFVDIGNNCPLSPSKLLGVGNSVPTFKAGDALVAALAFSRKSRGNDGQVYTIRDGDILIATGNHSMFRIAAGKERTVAIEFPPHNLKTFPHRFFGEGKLVRILTAIKYRQRELQGMVGEVLLPTDREGDVGVQFAIDIGAGSLDGVGQEGRCLYVPAQALEEFSG